MVSEVGGTAKLEVRGEPRLPGMETPKGGEEPIPRRMADEGDLVIEVTDVDTE